MVDPQQVDMAMMTEFFRKAMGFQGIPQNKLSKYRGSPRRPGDPSLQEWLDDFNEVVTTYDLSAKDQCKALVDHLVGPAREEVMCLSPESREKVKDIEDCLKLCFGSEESVKSLSSAFYNSVQGEGESLAEYSRSPAQAIQQNGSGGSHRRGHCCFETAA